MKSEEEIRKILQKLTVNIECANVATLYLEGKRDALIEILED